MTPDDFRRLALSFPSAAEGEHMGHPDFRAPPPAARPARPSAGKAGGARGPIFASLSGGEDGEARGMIKLPLDRQEALTAAHPDIFSPCAGAWGRQGCTNVNLPAARMAILRPAMAAAYRRAAGAQGAARGR